MSDFPDSTYLVYQEERGSSGTHHLQGYVEFASKKSLRQMQDMVPGAHYEPRAGTAEQAATYCKKEESRLSGPYEYGRISQQGMPHRLIGYYSCLQELFQLNYCACTIYLAKYNTGRRSDLLEVKVKLDARQPMTVIAEEHFGSWVRYHKSFEKYASMKTPNRTTVDVHVMIGPPGIGKTHKAISLCPQSCYMHTPGTQWFADYNGETLLVFDEFRWNDFPFEFMLSVCDPLKSPQLQVKGSNIKCTSTIVVFTGNNSPKDWYPNNKFHAFVRRVHHWWVFDPANIHQPREYTDFQAFLEHLGKINLYRMVQYRNAGDP